MDLLYFSFRLSTFGVFFDTMSRWHTDKDARWLLERPDGTRGIGTSLLGQRLYAMKTMTGSDVKDADQLQRVRLAHLREMTLYHSVHGQIFSLGLLDPLSQ